MAKRCKRHKSPCAGCGKDLSKERDIYCVKFNYKWVASYCEKCYKERYKR